MVAADTPDTSASPDTPVKDTAPTKAVLSDKGLKPGSRGLFVVEELQKANAWLDAAGRTAKFCKMKASAYAFYRGTNHLFWTDHGQDKRLAKFGGSATRTWLQGDLHAYNFGSFDDDNGDVIYDLNDFDESLIADYQYDVWRMAASLALIARQNGLKAADEPGLLDAFSEAYLDTLADFVGNKKEKTTSYGAANTGGKLKDFLQDIAKNDSRAKMLADWTHVVGGKRVFAIGAGAAGGTVKHSAKLAAVDAKTEAALVGGMPKYGATLTGGIKFSPAYFAIKSVARRLDAGTGSLGAPRYYLLIEGASSSDKDDRILDVKRQTAPSGLKHLSAAEQAVYNKSFANEGHRHATAYRALINHTDDHLGWVVLADGVYSVRDRSPYKEPFPTEKLDTAKSFKTMAEQWGEVLATAHARADKDYDAGLVPHSFDKEVDKRTDGEHKAFRKLVRDVALPYADQVAKDFAVFTAALSAVTCP